jgi:hypothetical protein
MARDLIIEANKIGIHGNIVEPSRKRALFLKNSPEIKDYFLLYIILNL